MLFPVLGHIETEMIGNDRPLTIGPGDDAQLTRSLGMVPKLTYKKYHYWKLKILVALPSNVLQYH